MRAGLPIMAVALGCAAAVMAQTPPGESPKAGPLVSRRAASIEIASCILDKDRETATLLTFIDFPHKDEKPSPAWKQLKEKIELLMSRCMASKYEALTLNVNELRAVTAEILLTESAGALLQRAAGLPPVPATRVTAVDGNQAMEPVFACTVRAMPVEAAAMIAAPAKSIAEAQAFRSITPALQACVPLDVALHIQPADVRLYVAYALYRFARPDNGVSA